MSTIKYINAIHPSGATTNIVNDASGNVTVGATLAMSSSFLRNRIINGAMQIDQRNAGASVTPATDGYYTLDRWVLQSSQASKIAVQRSTTVPSGFNNSLAMTVASAATVGTTDYFVLTQRIEGFNVGDLNFGTSSAQTINLSFWVRSSVTGTYPVTFMNAAQNRRYVATYTVNAANTWEQKTITVSGDTTGTWATDNSTGLSVNFSVGSGSAYAVTANTWGTSGLTVSGAASWVANAGATFYITGVQLEVGTVATPFERRLYGQELMLCQRYLYRLTPTSSSTNPFFANASLYNGTTAFASGQFPQQMRAVPTLFLEGAASDYALFVLGTAAYLPLTNFTLNAVTTNSFFLTQLVMASGGVTGYASYLTGNGQNTYGIQFSAEL